MLCSIPCVTAFDLVAHLWAAYCDCCNFADCTHPSSSPCSKRGAVRAGYRVVAVASDKHHDWITTKLGADQCVDYHAVDWLDQITKDAGNKRLAMAFDAIGAFLC